ncbi:hypothetical protein APHAL10511_004030 [Amanita phalloides]|nr:hypothetical protein APHAL10511_004030 [Amanita phalloides]
MGSCTLPRVPIFSLRPLPPAPSLFTAYYQGWTQMVNQIEDVLCMSQRGLQDTYSMIKLCQIQIDSKFIRVSNRFLPLTNTTAHLSPWIETICSISGEVYEQGISRSCKQRPIVAQWPATVLLCPVSDPHAWLPTMTLLIISSAWQDHKARSDERAKL